ncbi:unnamed protein product [Linum tenue]|uniref:Barwin domain-containing protein n=1 Tax=Linum tenue TaxID=586396 RepID=A0AAV0N7S3_9ROSI|nr:unnamed protein product [Linum tenue]
MLAAAVATCILILGALQQTTTAQSASTVERSDHMCGKYHDGSWAYCDKGRCCSNKHYCGDDWEHCNHGHCWYQCHEVAFPPPPFASVDPQSNHDEVADQTAGGGEARAPLLLNATLHDLYLNGDHDDNEYDLVEVRPRANIASSSSSSFSSPLSCAASLSRLPLASRHKYPLAALRAPRSRNMNASATHCGRCLKVTSFGVGGLPNQVKVRIAHEDINQLGLELDFSTFRQLDTDDNGITKGCILAMYQFVGC